MVIVGIVSIVIVRHHGRVIWLSSFFVIMVVSYDSDNIEHTRGVAGGGLMNCQLVIIQFIDTYIQLM
jgi:hypothetical protein